MSKARVLHTCGEQQKGVYCGQVHIQYALINNRHITVYLLCALKLRKQGLGYGNLKHV